MSSSHLPERHGPRNTNKHVGGETHNKPAGKSPRTSKVKTSPHIVAVQGLSMDNNSYIADESDDEKMGNQNSHDDVAKKEGQLDPLTNSKKAKHKADDKIITHTVEIDSPPDNRIENSGAEASLKDSKNKRNSLLKDDIEGDNGATANNNGMSKNIKGGDATDGSYEIKAPNDIDVIEVAGKDDVDAASTYSLFMEKDFRYYFQHPYCRLFVAYFVVFCNFLIYAEDPVAHSRKECYIPMIGNAIAFVGTKYPPNAWSLLKVVFWLAGIVIGCLVGKLLIHGILFNRLFRLKMFSDDQGSWMMMFLGSLVCVFIMSCFYNLFLMIGGDTTEAWRISDLMGVRNTFFMKLAACGTWCGDFFTAWMVTDIMLQEKLYPGWARPVRTWWKHRYNRIILFWIIVVITSFIVIFVIATDYIQWDKLNRDFMPTNEVSRAFLASFILVMDLMIVMQDWDFPHFMGAIDIKLPGLNTAHIRFEIPQCLRKEVWKVHITGRWFNYGILFLVMLLDLNMWKNQMFFIPYDYGQYIGPGEKIWSVQDDYSLENFNETQISYAYRSNNTDPNTGDLYFNGDTHMNTRFLDTAIAIKAIAFIPSLVAFIIFGVLIWLFGRFKPSDDDPYAGRLKKRRKRWSLKSLRASFRMPWRRKEEVRRKIHAVPKLLYFKKKGGSRKDDNAPAPEPTELPTEAFTEK